MFVRGLTVSVATLVAFGILASSAEADHRKKHRRAKTYDYYYSGPEVVRGVPGLRLFFGDYALTEEEFDALYGNEREFDEGYYEPEPAPVKPKKKAAKPAVASVKKASPAKDLNTASIDDAKKPVTKSTTSKPAAGEDTASNAKKPAPATAGMTCDKATSIVGGYGFSSVKPETCNGKVYAFNATRDGKSFAIKVDSASGELTEVKKLP
jgi:hypothetical protein